MCKIDEDSMEQDSELTICEAILRKSLNYMLSWQHATKPDTNPPPENKPLFKLLLRSAL